jgi:hypothetical protein
VHEGESSVVAGPDADGKTARKTALLEVSERELLTRLIVIFIYLFFRTDMNAMVSRYAV